MAEYVFSGGRLKLLLPSEGLYITFGMEGVQCPGVERPAVKGPDGKMKPGRKAEPMGQEALLFLRELVNHQDLEVECDSIDKNGVMLGSVFVGKGGQRKNVAVELLQRGLAYCMGGFVEKLRGGAEMLAAEGAARKAGRGVWDPAFAPEKPEGELEEVEDELEAAAAAAASLTAEAPLAASLSGMAISAASSASASDFPAIGAGKTGGAAAAGGSAWGKAASSGGAFGSSAAASGAGGPGLPLGAVLVQVSDIADGSRFSFQSLSPAEKARLDSITAKMEALQREHGLSPAALTPEALRKGKVVAAIYDEPGVGPRWNRARIEAKLPGGGAAAGGSVGSDAYTVTFMDYGNQDTVVLQRMRPLEPALAALPPCAREAVLAHVRVPSLSAEYGNEAAHFLSDAIYGRTLLAQQYYKEGAAGVAAVGLFEPPAAGAPLSSATCIAEQLLKAGLGRIARTEAKKAKRRAATAAPGDALVAAEQQYLQRLEGAYKAAKSAHAGIFRYGDVGDSDAEK